MTERILSELQKEYRNFFLEKMKLYGVKSPAELTKEKKSEFFTEIKNDWTKYKLTKKQRLETTNVNVIVEEPTEIYDTEYSTKIKSPKTDNYKQRNQDEPVIRRKATDKQPSITKREQEQEQQVFTKQIIKSEPNNEQTDDLSIQFSPINHFSQDDDYLYPVVKMPNSNCLLKLPRQGRSNQKGYKENDFCSLIKSLLPEIGISDNVHMVIPNFNKPYEPDIVLFDKSINLYIDIEIDEPYDGYYRYPTHYTHPEQDVKQDNIRDLFFTESGWLVIRFTEKQVHCQPLECISYIKNVLNSLYNKDFTTKADCIQENQWDYNQCIQWQKIYYREKYLGIERFQKRYSYKEIEINSNESESIETVINRTKLFQFDTWSSSLAFDEETHKYIHPKDETGNAEYISVTTLIERFFPFDLKRYIEKKAADENRTEEDVLDEYLTNRDEAAEKGTYLHNQIENFLKGIDYEADSNEFQMFLNFYENEIQKRKLSFFDAEKMIFSNKYNVAGTIDCLFKNEASDEYVMLDWKRSKKLIIDGRPRIFGYGYALSELSNLDNSSYYRYCLQQNIYKHIAETEYSMKISSMKLVVLHDNYPNYYVVNVPEMKKETKVILNSLNHKI
jgi:hypothetical protein